MDLDDIMASLLAALLDVPRVEFDVASGPHPQIPTRDETNPSSRKGWSSKSGRNSPPCRHLSRRRCRRCQPRNLPRKRSGGIQGRGGRRCAGSRGRRAGIRLLVVRLGKIGPSLPERRTCREPSPTAADTPSPPAPPPPQPAFQATALIQTARATQYPTRTRRADPRGHFSSDDSAIADRRAGHGHQLDHTRSAARPVSL